MTTVDSIDALVVDLYRYRDQEFSISVKEKEDELVKKKEAILEIIKEADGDTGDAHHVMSARLQYLKGKALNIGQSYDDEAQKLLSKAVKRDPSILGAWTALGDAFWKKKDYDNARNCFSCALEKDTKNLEALCGMSMVLRQIKAEDGDSRRENVEKSIQYAKDAVAADMNSSNAWYVLGNSYLSSFFILSHKTKDLKMALNAYNFAETKSKAAGYTVVSPDLLYNRATVCKFQELYQEALDGFQAAMAADPTLTEAVTDAEDVVKLVARVADIVENKGKMKPKKLRQLTEQLAKKSIIPEQPKGLAGGVLASCKQGANTSIVLNLKIVAVVSAYGAVPLIGVACDKEGSFCAVSVYNVSPDAINFNDQLTIIKPTLREVTVKAGDQSFKYPCISVHDPSTLVKNRQHQLSDYYAESRLSLQTGT